MFVQWPCRYEIPSGVLHHWLITVTLKSVKLLIFNKFSYNALIATMYNFKKLKVKLTSVSSHGNPGVLDIV